MRQLSQAQNLPAVLAVQGRSLEFISAEAVSIPWTIWLMVAGITTSLFGGTWDFAWHMAIGRDTFWTPPHILVQSGGVLVGIACVYTILATTFAGASEDRKASVQVLGLYGPGGAFIAVWGSLAMFASAPFDNWWHNAYGLDVKIITPPHGLLSLGYLATQIGAMFWIAAMIHRSHQALRSRLAWLFLIVGSISVAVISVMIMPLTLRINMHTAACYLAVAVFIPSMMVATARGSGHRWGCTIVAGFYTALGLGSEWLLPLSSAQPKLGPVYHHITHLIPLQFPLLFLVPAFVADLLLQRQEQRSSWMKAFCDGPAFLLSFFAVQWAFANFLASPASRNWIFGTAYFSYFDPAGFLYDPYQFQATEKLSVFLSVMAVAIVASVMTVRFGLAWGDWMRHVRR